MLTDRSNRISFAFTTIGFLLFLLVQVLMVVSKSDSFDLSSTYKMIELNCGFIIIMLFGYTGYLVQKILSEDIESGVMKIWLSLPVSRMDYFIKVIRNIFVRVIFVSILLFLSLSLVINLLCGSFPENLFLSTLSIFELVFVLVAMMLFLTTNVRKSFSQVFLILFPLMTFFTQLLVFMLSKSANADVFSKISYSILVIIIPINLCYTNIVYGLTPQMQDTTHILHASGTPLYYHAYVLFWFLFVGFLVVRRMGKFEIN